MQKTLITFSNEDIAERNLCLREISCTLDVISYMINNDNIDKEKIEHKINYMHGLIHKIIEHKYIVSHLEQED